MKKTAYSLVLPFIFVSLFSCSNDMEIIEPSLELQPTQAMSTKNSTKELMKKYIDKSFSFLDKNKDKKLSFTEFKNLIPETSEVMKVYFTKTDLNKDEFISNEEFYKYYSVSMTNSSKEMFSMLDKNKNNFLDIENEEVQVAIEDTLNNMEGNKITLEEIKNDYISRDSNKDGKLTFEDYQNVALKYMLIAYIEFLDSI